MVGRRRGRWLNLWESAPKMKWSCCRLPPSLMACTSCRPLLPHHTTPHLLLTSPRGRCSIQRLPEGTGLRFLSLFSWSIGRQKNRKTKSFWRAEGRWKQRWIYFPLKAFVMRDQHIIPTPPFPLAFVLCTRAYLREEAIIFAGSEAPLTLIHRSLYSTNEVRKTGVWWRLMVLAEEGEKNTH